MIAGRDSSFHRPSEAQLQQAKAAGVRIWGGYLTTKPNVGIASPWDQASFERVRSVLGTTPLAYASGWDDPVACKQKAEAWKVRLCLDNEAGIRAGLTPEQHQRRLEVRGPRRLDGSWVQPWLDAAGAGLYGNGPVFNGRRAPFFVIAAYPSQDPGRTWPSGSPGVPCGWQWAGTHDEFGGGVDSAWFDDWFLEEAEDMTGDQDAVLRAIYNLVLFGADGKAGRSFLADVPAQAKDVHEGMGALVSSVPGKPPPLVFEIRDGVKAIRQRVDQLGQPTIDVQALASLLTPTLGPLLVAALAQHVPDPEAIAKAVLADLGAVLPHTP